MAKSKTIVTVVCTMLICLLMMFSCVSLFGCALDKSAGYYETKNFVGEYKNKNRSEYIYNFGISIDNNGEKVHLYSAIGCTYVNGVLQLEDAEARRTGKADYVISEADIDANVMTLIKYFAEVFSGDCVVSETEFKFVATGTSMKIIRNEYVGTQGYPDYWVPRRLIDVYDESKQVTLPCCLTTTYYAKDEGVVVEDDTSFGFETDYIPVKGSDGVIYEVVITLHYYIKQK